jgi:hypothetical protein
LGYHTKFNEKRINLKSVKFLGIYKNEFITLDNRGLLPSISRLFAQPWKSPKNKKDSVNVEEVIPENDKNNFRYFWKFMADNETYLIPIDHSDFTKGTVD